MESMFSGRFIFSTALAIALAAFSLSTIWYEAEASRSSIGDTDVISGDVTWTTQRIVFYVGFYERTSGTGSYTSGSYAEFDSQVGELMSTEQLLIIAWIAVGLAFIGSCVADFRKLRFVFSIVLMVIGIAAVGLFASSMINALDSDIASGYFTGTPEDMPFYGTRIGGVHAYFAPGLGFWLVVLAASLQLLIVAVMVKFEIIDPARNKTPGTADSDDETTGTA